MNNLLKILKIFTVASVASTTFATATDSIVIFDAKKGIGENPSDKIERSPDGWRVIQEKIWFTGNWDFSENLDFEIDIENTHKTKNLSIQVILSDDGKINSDPSWACMETIAPAERKVVTIKYPRPPTYPELTKKMKLMRTDPFGNHNGKARPNLKKIKSVVVDRHWATNFNYIIRSIKAKKHNPADKPIWITYDEKQLFPFIDKYGQFKFKDWKDKVKSDDDLKTALALEDKDLAKHISPANRTKFGGWEKGKRYEATGHFRFQKIDGKWWMIDPEGYLFWSHGVVRVTPSSAVTPLDGRHCYFEDLPKADSEYALFYTTNDELLAPHYAARGIKETYDFSSANIRRKYGKDWRAKYAEKAHQRLLSWGLNTIANSSDSYIYLQRKTPYVERFEVKGDALSGKGAWWPFRDPFSPSFRKNIKENLQKRKAMLNDPWCIGFFVDNEIHWGTTTTLAENTILSEPTLRGKIRFADDLKKKYSTIEKLNESWGTNFADWDAFLKNREVPKNANKQDMEAFTRSMTEEYFKAIRECFNELAPNKLYLGCRFAGSIDKDVLYTAAKYADAISYNRYTEILDTLSLPKDIDKPIMIGEWHFGALDRGKLHSTLIKVKNQDARAKAYYNYAKSALENPYVVGIHWHQFSDQATTGRFDGENFQVGFTDVCDTPYWETIEKIREIGYNMYEIRMDSKNKLE